MKKLLTLLCCFAFVIVKAQNSTLLFNGSSQYAEIPDHNNLDLSNNFTIEAWVRPTGAGSQVTEGGMIINKENSYEVVRFADGTLRYALSANGAGNDWAWINTGFTAPLNTWTHFALVKSGTSVSFYVNGSSVFTAAAPATLVANSQTLRIGNRTSIGHFFNGYIDEVRIWNTSKTQAAIKANIYNKNISNSAANLVAYYRFNEGSGATTANSSTNTSGIDGNLIGAAGWSASPIEYAKNALGFDVTNNLVTIPNNATLNISGAITIEAWVYATSTSGIQSVFSKSTQATNTGYIFPRTDDGWSNAVFYLHIGGWHVLSAPYPSLNAWHHMAATYDGANMRIYIDGIQAASMPQTGAITTNANALYIGDQPGHVEYFGGRIDDIRVWNVARTQSQIYSNMNAELDPATQTNLVSYYTFNQGIAGGANSGMTNLVDMAGNNNGVLGNFLWSGSASNFLQQNSSLTTLPVTWNNFTGTFVNNDILLQWSTSTEQNSKSFIVQHSTNGEQWTDLAEMAAAGNSNTLIPYQYIHVHPPAGHNYYRIRQLDMDDKSATSKIILVKITDEHSGLHVYPNPLSGRTLTVVLTEPAKLLLYNNAGHVIMRKSLTAGIHRLELPALSAGIYQLSDGRQTIKLVVQ